MTGDTDNRIPPERLEEFARALGLSQAILVGWAAAGTTHVVTWGDSLTDSAQAGQGGNFVKRALGFPECSCMDLSPRVAAALDRAEELTAERDRARAEVERLQARLEETNDVLGKFIVASDARIAELRAREAQR